MALPKDKEPDTPEPPAGQEPAGRVEFDSRGNSVWRWARDVLDSTSILLKRLENKDLAIEPTQKVPIIRGGKADQADKAGKPGKPGKPEKKSARARGAELRVSADPGARDSGGFDPYNSRR
jgi:hypothetical protein